jgi:hypothetical protein
MSFKINYKFLSLVYSIRNSTAVPGDTSHLKEMLIKTGMKEAEALRTLNHKHG